MILAIRSAWFTEEEDEAEKEVAACLLEFVALAEPEPLTPLFLSLMATNPFWVSVVAE